MEIFLYLCSQIHDKHTTGMKKSILGLIFLGLTMPLWAAERSEQDAAQIAAQFMNNEPDMARKMASPRKASQMKMAYRCMKKNSEEPAYYVFNQESGGYIIVSGDDRTEDVLVYAEQGTFDPEHINPNFRFWLKHLQEEISMANDSNAVDKVTPRKATTAIGPLLKNKDGKDIEWYQETPYNNLCPIDKYDNTRSLTGCVATAMAQIMYMWRYPAKGTGSKTYTWTNANKKSQKETLTANFGETTYDWDNMLPTYYNVQYTNTQANAVATLMYQLGVACEMDYGGDAAGGSGAWTDDMGAGVTTYFGYKVDRFITSYSRSDYGTAAFSPAEYNVTVDKFEAYFNEDLEAGRPIIMGGEGEDGGHEFVCDGRNTSGYFHINWGWEGDGNNYCKLSSLKPQGYSYNFSSNLDALIGLQPAQIDTVHVTGVTVSPATATLKINEKTTLTATIAPTNATVKKINWSSSNINVATVTDAGMVRGIGAGEAVITAMSPDGSKKGTATITVTNEVVAADVFTLVTDASELSKGDDIIIVTTHKSVHYGATTELTGTSRSGYLGVEEVAIEKNTITLAEGASVAVFTLDGSAGAWTLTNDDQGQLGATDAKKLKWNDGTQTWTIAISNDNATIASTNTNKGRILFNYNNGSSRFSTYTSSTSATMLLPQIYARSASVKPSVVPVTGVKLGQTTAQMIEDAEILMYYEVLPATATNKGITWTSSRPDVAKITSTNTEAKTGVLKALAEGTTTITITTADGGFTATCLVTVSKTPIVAVDTTYVTPSEARAIGMNLAAGSNTEPHMYAVTGYVTVPNSSSYHGFWMADKAGNEQIFQGFECTLPSRVVVLEEGLYIRVFGYIMNYNDEKAQIKNGEVVILDEPGPSALENISVPATMNKCILNGHLYLIKDAMVYDCTGRRIK